MFQAILIILGYILLEPIGSNEHYLIVDFFLSPMLLTLLLQNSDTNIKPYQKLC